VLTDSTLSVLAPKGTHMSSTSMLPLAMSEVDLGEIIRKGKTTQKGTSIAVPSFSNNFHNPFLQYPVVFSDSPIIQNAGVSRNLSFGRFPYDFYLPILGFEGDIFDTPFSPEVVKWKERDLTLEEFPTPPHIRVVVVAEGETYVPSSPLSSPPRNIVPVSHSPTPSPPGSPPVHIQMEISNPPKTGMEAIVATRYDPLILPQPMNAPPMDGYLKQLP
jgi:hypothetical protein